MIQNKVNTVAIVDPIGGYGGMDFYDYGLAFGLGARGIKVHLHTCNSTKLRKYENVVTKYSFSDLWNYNKILKSLLFFRYQFEVISDLRKNGIKIVHFHFFGFSFPNYIILKLYKIRNINVIITLHDIVSFSKKQWLSLKN